jgi:hypothetical protein
MAARPPGLSIVDTSDYRRTRWQILGFGCIFRRPLVYNQPVSKRRDSLQQYFIASFAYRSLSVCNFAA